MRAQIDKDKYCKIILDDIKKQKNITLIEDEVIDLMIFNLGYLPGGDHQVITKPHQTIDAINEGLEKLSKSGVITIVAYPGTTEGFEEMQMLKSYLSDLEQKLYNVCHWHPMNQINNPPEVIYIAKTIKRNISLFIMNKTHNQHVKAPL